MKRRMLLVLLAIGISVCASAQTVVWTVSLASKFAATISDCPSATALTGLIACPVIPTGGAQPYLVWSVPGYNEGKPFVILSPGAPATVSAGTTSTGAPGSAAAVTADGSSSPQHLVLDFLIPQGMQGAPGVVQTGGTVQLMITAITCPKGTGSISAGWKAANCPATATITGYTPPK